MADSWFGSRETRAEAKNCVMLSTQSEMIPGIVLSRDSGTTGS